jgi:Protein of unknown function (DUF1364)
MITNPMLLPKIRSNAIMAAAYGQPCSLRIASFVGLSCYGSVVGCHLPVTGRGVSTKATDLAVAFGCQCCHDILDGRNQNVQALILEKYPAALANRLLNALVETQARLVDMGIITVPGAEIV